ncbi:MAG: divalent cation tolerance protein CutA [Kiritimatiellae bacterium]|nr:divalent cation tolerance protein CutA [Kiritimatiellia bacterium]
MEISFVYVTTKDREEAQCIGKALLERKLAACINILESVESMYWWDGAIQHETEAVMIAKTRSELVEAVTQTIKEVHSYTCPCIVAWPITQGNPDFLKWASEETKPLSVQSVRVP